MSLQAVTSTETAARQRADRIRARIEDIHGLLIDIADAYRERDWEALGYENWGAYCAGEFGDSLHALRSNRQKIVAFLDDAGLPTRAIASLTGTSHTQVIRDRNQLEHFVPVDDDEDDEPYEPPRKIGLDGKSRPARMPAPQPDEPPVPAFSTSQFLARFDASIVGLCEAIDRFLPQIDAADVGPEELQEALASIDATITQLQQMKTKLTGGTQ